MGQVENWISPMLSVILVRKTSLVIVPPNTCLSGGSFHHCGTLAMFADSNVVQVAVTAVTADEAPSKSMVVSMSPVLSSLKSMPSFSKLAMG